MIQGNIKPLIIKTLELPTNSKTSTKSIMVILSQVKDNLGNILTMKMIMRQEIEEMDV